MTIRMDYLGAKLVRFLQRFSAPRDLSDQGRADATAALLRAIDRTAPASGYDVWWPRFEDELEATMRTRAWPTVNEVQKAAQGVPGPKAVSVSLEDAEEAAWREQLRRWWKREPWPGRPDKPVSIAPRIVTQERCMAVGMTPDEADRAVRFAADPYNHGIDPKLTPEDRQRHAERVNRKPEWQKTPAEVGLPRNWTQASEVA